MCDRSQKTCPDVAFIYSFTCGTWGFAGAGVLLHLTTRTVKDDGSGSESWEGRGWHLSLGGCLLLGPCALFSGTLLFPSLLCSGLSASSLSSAPVFCCRDDKNLWSFPHFALQFKPLVFPSFCVCVCPQQTCLGICFFFNDGIMENKDKLV